MRAASVAIGPAGSAGCHATEWCRQGLIDRVIDKPVDSARITKDLGWLVYIDIDTGRIERQEQAIGRETAAATCPE